MKENYTYPVLLDRNDPGYVNIYFPGFDGGNPEIPMMTAVSAGEDPIAAAQDALAMEIMEYESTGRELPAEDMTVSPGEGQQLVYVNLWMPYHRSTVRETYVKKTLTIPAWLDILARRQNINFSSVLTSALMDTLNLPRTPSDREKEVICAEFSRNDR